MGTMASWRLAVLVVAALQCLSVDGCPSDCRCFLTDEGEDAANCTGLAALSDFTASLQVLYVLSPPETPVHAVDLSADTFQALPHLKYLHLNNASLEQLHPETFSDLKELRYLDVSFNFLSDVGQLVKLMQQLPHLEVLNARGNPFMMLPPSTTLFNSKSLQSLDLGFCGFESIPDVSFKNLSSLEYLYLDGNSLKYVSFASFPKHIRYINLSNNQLEALDIYGLPELEYLHEVELAGSSLQCTCDLLGVRDMLVEQGLVSEKPVVCAEPPEYQGKSWLEVKKETVCQSEAQYSPHRDSGEQRAGAPDSHEMMQGDQPMADVSQEDEDDDELEEDSAMISGDSELIPHGDHSNGAVKLMPLLDGAADDENDSETDPQYSDYSDVDTASDASASNDEGSGEPLSSADASEGAQITSDELSSSSEVDGNEDEDDYEDDMSSSNDDPKESALSAADEDDDEGPEDSDVASIDNDSDETENSSTAAGSDETDDGDNTYLHSSDAYVDSNGESEDISLYDSHPADTNESSGEPEYSLSSANYTDDEEDSDTSAGEDEDDDDVSTSSNTTIEDVNLASKESDAISATEDYLAESVSEEDSGGTVVETDVVEYKNHEKEGDDVISLVNTDDAVGEKEQGSVQNETEHEHPLTTESSADDNDELKNVFLVAHTNENTSSSDEVTEESNEHEVSESNSDSEEPAIMETSSGLTTENNSDSEDEDINMDDDKGNDESQPISEKSRESEDSNAGTILDEDSSNGDDEEEEDDDEEESNDDDEDSNSALDVGSLLHSGESKSRSTGGQTEPKDDTTESTGEDSSTEKTELPDDERTTTEENKSVADESESEDDGIHIIHLENESAEDGESESEEETKAEDDENKPKDEILEAVGIDETSEDPEPTDEESDSERKATSSHEDDKDSSDEISEEHNDYLNPTSEEPAEVYEEHIESKVAVGSAHEPGVQRGLGAIPDVVTTEEYIDLSPSDAMTTGTYESTEATVIKSANVAPGSINRNIIIPPNYEDMSRKSGNTKASINEIGVSGSEDKVSFSEEKPPENSTASFVVLGCIMAAIVALLGYAVVRSRMQKAAEKRRSVEKKDPNMRELKEMRSLLKPEGDIPQHATELASLLSPDSVQVIPNGLTLNGSAKMNHDTPEKTAGPQKPPRNIDQNRGANLTDVIVEQVPESLKESDVELRRLPADKVGNGVNTVDADKSQIYEPDEERPSSLPVRARLSDIPAPLKQRPVFITNPGPKPTNELL